MPTLEQLKEVEKQKTFNRIPPWHAAGVKGAGVVALNFETPGLADKHCESCTDRFKHSAPEATVHEVGISETDPNGYSPVCLTYRPGQAVPVETVIKETGARIGIRSTGGPLNDPEAIAYWKAIEEKYNFILITVPGMNNGDRTGGAFPAALSIHVGACNFNDAGQIVQPPYTLTSLYIKFVNFMGYLNGMSFSAPYTAGMVALLLQKWPWFRREDAIAYFKDHSVDLYNFGAEKPGFDDISGWGVPYMGDVNEVRVAPSTTTKQQVTAELSEMYVKMLPLEELRRLRRLFYGNENYVRLRDIEDVLGLIDVEYDAVNKMPTVKD